ncbi:MAG: penicillin-binding protein 1B, partial [Gammaproteobacteria bacterium]|nr:penicillin-binding protein 1B [Gammaproteobacteria bacterium]
MSRPRKRMPPKARRTRGGWFRRFVLRRLLVTLPFIVLGFGAYLAYLDYRIREEFEGKKWSLPARIYSAPLELYVGSGSAPDRLEQRLVDLKFRADPALATRATYARRGSGFVLKTRAFRFPDRPEPARTVRVDYEGGRISGLYDLEKGRNLAVLRLEPVQVGSLYPTIKEDRILIKLSQAPELLLQALFSVEDRDFYQHSGISARGILRALWVNARSGAIVQGGSTLTQQLVKNLFLSSQRTWWRKINEAFMALILEARYSKQQILEAYLNEIYLGQDGARAVHGFALASQYYFGRSLSELELQHMATLVGLVRGPSYYDPFRAPDRVLNRRNVVLDAMAEQHYVSIAQAGAAKSKPLDVVDNPHQPTSQYPAF